MLEFIGLHGRSGLGRDPAKQRGSGHDRPFPADDRGGLVGRRLRDRRTRIGHCETRTGVTARSELEAPEPPVTIPAAGRSILGPGGIAPVLLIGLGALLVRVLYLWQLRGSPLVTTLMGDAEAYDRSAREIAAGNWLGREVFYQAPLYPYFLAVVYAAVGHSLWAVRMIQIALGSVSCVFLARAGRDFFGTAAGLVAGILLALDPTAIFFDGLIQKNALDLFFFTLVLVCAGRLEAKHGEGSGLWTGAGVAVGALSLTRENAVLLAAALALWLWIRFRSESPSRRLARTGALVGGLALVLVPVALRNLAVGGELHLTTAQLGPNLYIGNNAQSDGTYAPLRPGRGNARFERRDATDLAEQALGRTLSPGEISRYWTGRALSWIGLHTADWIRLLGWKSLLVWNAAEIGDTEDQYTYGDWSWLLRGLTHILNFGVLCPLAVLGALVSFRERGRHGILYFFAALYAASVALFYVSARYRYPLVPIVILFAGAGLVRGAALLRGAGSPSGAAGGGGLPGEIHESWRSRLFRRGALRSLAPAAAFVLGAAVLVNLPIKSKAAMQADTYFNLGATLAEAGSASQAIECYERALRIDPDLGEAHNNLGVLLSIQGKLPEAADHLEAASRLTPGSAKARNNLGVALARMGRFGEAEMQYRASLASEPGSAETRNNLGLVLMQQGKLPEAEREFSEALGHDAANVKARINLGLALAAQGRDGEAIVQFREAIRLEPRSAEAHLRLGRALARLGRDSDARAELAAATELDPSLASGERVQGPAGHE